MGNSRQKWVRLGMRSRQDCAVLGIWHRLRGHVGAVITRLGDRITRLGGRVDGSGCWLGDSSEAYCDGFEIALASLGIKGERLAE